MSQDLLRFATAGSVDDGKSTMIGRLLLDCRAVREDQLAAVVRASRLRGDPYVDLALLTDGLRAEREQGITIDVAYRYFSTPRRTFIIADTPGHVQYTRNMVTGASTAELVIILVDASKGVVTQTKRHGLLASILRIPHVVLAVNKMDAVGYDERVFRRVADDYAAFAERLATHSLVCLPLSALHGDNVVARSTNMPWFTGTSLLSHLEQVNVGAARNLIDLRLAVQMTIRQHGGYRGIAGQVASGTLRPGEEVVILPTGLRSTVRAIRRHRDTVAEAVAGDSVVVTLEDDLDVGRGDVIVRPHNQPLVATDVDCTLCWLDDDPMEPDAPYLVQHTTRRVPAKIAGVSYRLNVDTLHREEARTLRVNEIGRVQLSTADPLVFDSHQVNRATSGFILIDSRTTRTVAAGVMRQVSRSFPDVTPRTPRRRRSANIRWEAVAVDRDLRESLHGHRAAVLWLTGLSGSGKTTLARALDTMLSARGVETFMLDGDNLRHGLNGDLGFTAADRSENIRRAAEVAKLAFDHGSIVICTFVSPFRRDRDFARGLIAQGRFFEVFVRCSIDVCRTRDPKGLYERADRGEVPDFTGVSSPYEEPTHAELVVDTIEMSPEAGARAVYDLLVARGLVPSSPTPD